MKPSDILAMARANYIWAKQIPLSTWMVPSDAWRKNLERMAAAIPDFKTCAEAIDFAQRNEMSGFDHRANFSEERSRLQLAAIERRHPGFHLIDTVLSESPWSRFQSLGQMHGRLVSNAFLWHLAQLLGLKAVAPQCQSVLEIGGGYGGLALLGHREGIAWVIVDFPESLFFVDVYLCVNGTQPPRITPDSLIPDSLLVRSYSMAVNCGSFGEMPADTVAGWLAEIERLGIPLLYSCNYAETPWPADMGKRWVNVVSHRGTQEPLLGPSLDTGNAWEELAWRRR